MAHGALASPPPRAATTTGVTEGEGVDAALAKRGGEFTGETV
jgi:hypothetical protein